MCLKKIFLATLSIAIFFNLNAQTYKGTQSGKVLRDWYIAGALKVSEDSSHKPDIKAQENFFNRKDDQNIQAAFRVQTGGKPDLKRWNKFSSKKDIVDFDSIFRHPDFVSAYAYAVIESPDAKSAVLAIGSDDALKVWHNGKLVHKNWLPRGIVPDNDIIPISLGKGTNEILIEVQDMEGGWGFTARFLDEKGLTARLIKAA